MSRLCYIEWMATRTVSIRELRNSTSAVIEQLEHGDDVVLTNHGRPIARIVPMRPEAPATSLLARLDQLGTHDTGLAAEIAAQRADDAEFEPSSW